jgi:hypothetical protein
VLQLLLIFITFGAFIISWRKAGFLLFPTGLILVFAISQVMLLLVHDDLVYYGMHGLYDFGGLQANYTGVQFLYTGTALLSLLMPIGRYRKLKSLSGAAGLATLLKAKDDSSFLSSLLMISLCGFHLLVLMLISDWSKLWLHEQYLQSLVDDRWVALLGVEFSDTISRTSALFAILATFSACRLIGTRRRAMMIVASAMSTAYFLLLLSAHSRSAAFVPAVVAVNYLVLGLKRRKIVVPIMVVVAAVSLLGSLGGRNTDRHGLSTLPETILMPITSSDVFDDVIQGLMDFCQGAVVTAESFEVPGDFDLRYKILVFSPLPSFIDGYSSIRADSQHRLHDYVPMSGVGEVWHFGWPYACFLIIILTVFVRAHATIAEKVPVVFIICNFLITFSMYLLFSYPVRNALRYYWIGVFLLVAVSLAKRIRPGAFQGVSRSTTVRTVNRVRRVV